MKDHKIVLTITTVIFVMIILISIYAFFNDFFGFDASKIATCIILMILVLFYPIGFYTCYRLISDNDYKGIFINRFLIGKTDFKALFVVPLILSVFLVPDYISYFKYDLKRNSIKNDVPPKN